MDEDWSKPAPLFHFKRITIDFPEPHPTEVLSSLLVEDDEKTAKNPEDNGSQELLLQYLTNIEAEAEHSIFVRPYSGSDEDTQGGTEVQEQGSVSSSIEQLVREDDLGTGKQQADSSIEADLQTELYHPGREEMDWSAISDFNLQRLLRELPHGYLTSSEGISSESAGDAASMAEDSGSQNTRNEYWSVSSYRTPSSPSEAEDLVPPPPEFQGDFQLPLTALDTPIKKSTYDPITQDSVQKFLAGATWEADSPIQHTEATLWTSKRLPLQAVPVEILSPAPPPTETPPTLTPGDRFLESLEMTRREPQQLITRNDEEDRLQRYPGRELVCTEYMRDYVEGDVEHRVYYSSKRIVRTQNTNPPNLHLRQRRQGVIAGPSTAPLAPTVKDCAVCCEERRLGEFPRSAHLSGHDICKICVSQYLMVKILKEGAQYIACPGENCPALLEYNEIKEHAGVKAFAKYDELLCRRAYEDDPNFRWCTNPGCSVGQIVENGDESSHFTCMVCNFKSCFYCRTPAHPQRNCTENLMDAATEQFAADTETGEWLKAFSRSCTCGRWIQKGEGCDHVKCPDKPVGCGTEWCWQCGADYDEIRRIGNQAHERDCPHWA